MTLKTTLINHPQKWIVFRREHRETVSLNQERLVRRLTDHVPTHKPAYRPKRPMQNSSLSEGKQRKSDVAKGPVLTLTGSRTEQFTGDLLRKGFFGYYSCKQRTKVV